MDLSWHRAGEGKDSVYGMDRWGQRERQTFQEHCLIIYAVIWLVVDTSLACAQATMDWEVITFDPTVRLNFQKHVFSLMFLKYGSLLGVAHYFATATRPLWFRMVLVLVLALSSEVLFKKSPNLGPAEFTGHLQSLTYFFLAMSMALMTACFSLAGNIQARRFQSRRNLNASGSELSGRVLEWAESSRIRLSHLAMYCLAILGLPLLMNCLNEDVVVGFLLATLAIPAYCFPTVAVAWIRSRVRAAVAWQLAWWSVIAVGIILLPLISKRDLVWPLIFWGVVQSQVGLILGWVGRLPFAYSWNLVLLARKRQKGEVSRDYYPNWVGVWRYPATLLLVLFSLLIAGVLVWRWDRSVNIAVLLCRGSGIRWEDAQLVSFILDFEARQTPEDSRFRSCSVELSSWGFNKIDVRREMREEPGWLQLAMPYERTHVPKTVLFYDGTAVVDGNDVRIPGKLSNLEIIDRDISPDDMAKASPESDLTLTRSRIEANALPQVLGKVRTLRLVDCQFPLEEIIQQKEWTRLELQYSEIPESPELLETLRFLMWDNSEIILETNHANASAFAARLGPHVECHQYKEGEFTLQRRENIFQLDSLPSDYDRYDFLTDSDGNLLGYTILDSQSFTIESLKTSTVDTLIVDLFGISEDTTLPGIKYLRFVFYDDMKSAKWLKAFPNIEVLCCQLPEEENRDRFVEATQQLSHLRVLILNVSPKQEIGDLRGFMKQLSGRHVFVSSADAFVTGVPPARCLSLTTRDLYRLRFLRQIGIAWAEYQTATDRGEGTEFSLLDIINAPGGKTPAGNSGAESQ